VERVLFPYFIERSTNVPKNVLESFSNEELPEYISKLGMAKINLEAVIENSIGVLEEQFAIYKNNKILNYKRKVFNQKNIKEIDEELDPISRKVLEDYKKDYDRLENLKREYEESYQSTYENNRRLLHDFFNSNQEIPKAFSLINKNMDHKFKKYIRTPVDAHNADIRKLDHQLIRLLSRATMKTSPFSYLTSICFSGNSGQTKRGRKRESICEINNYIIKLIYDYLVLDPVFAVQCSYRISAYHQYETYYVFLGQQDYEKGKVYKTVDWSKSIARNKLLDLLIDRYTGRSFTYKELENFIKSLGLSEDKVSAYILDTLLKYRIITNANVIDESNGDIFTEFFKKVELLKDDKNGKLERICNLVIQLKVYLKDFSLAEWEERFQLIHIIDSLIKKLSKEIGKEFVHDILLYEDTIYRSIKKKVEIDERFLDNISQLQKYSRIFDQSYPVLLHFSEMFYEKFGDAEVRADNLEVYQEFVKAGSSMTEVWKDTLTENQESNNPNMQRIYEMKKRFKEFVFASKDSQSPVNIKEFIDREVANNEDLITEDDNSSTVFFQKGQDRYVINKIYNGNLIFFSRFLKLFEEIRDKDEYQSYIDKVFGDKTVEISECFGFNANVHIPVVKKRLILPLTDRNDPNPEDIDLSECYFKYSPNDSRVKLYHDDMGEIKVIYLGSLAYYLLPTIVKTIMGLRPSTRFDAAYMNFWSMEQGDKLVVDRVPEIVYDNIVIIRKQCLINNVFDMSRPVTELYHDVVNELKLQGFPTKFFIKAYVNKPGFDYMNMGRTQLKPQYIDLGNILLFKEFCTKLEKEEQIIIEEIKPYNEDDDFIYEYQMEYSSLKEA
jgi:hypothetical protein